MLELDDIAEVIAGAVRQATEPLLDRIVALEERELLPPEKGDPGDPGPQGEAGRDGEVDMDLVKQLVSEAVSAGISSIPIPEKGDPGDPGPQGEAGPAGEVDLAAIEQMVEKAVSELPPAEKGDPGIDVDMAEVARQIEIAVKSAAAGFQAPEDGKPGADGVGLADALRDNEGNLVLVMTDGRTKNLGKIDGEDGLPGRDGLGFDDLNVEQVGERTVRFLLKRENEEVEFDVTFPVPIYRGVFKDSESYERGDLSTWAGSLWHCNEPKGLKPGAPDSGWQLAAKAGRPGKDADK